MNARLLIRLVGLRNGKIARFVSARWSLLMFAAVVFYGWTCRAGASAFAARRERMLAAIERCG